MHRLIKHGVTWINKTWSDITRTYDQVRKWFFPRFNRMACDKIWTGLDW